MPMTPDTGGPTSTSFRLSAPTAKSTLRTLAVLGLVERVSFNGEEVKRHKIGGIYSTTVHSPLQPSKRTFTKALVTPGMGSGVEKILTLCGHFSGTTI